MDTVKTPTTTNDQDTYMWMVTVQWPTGSGFSNATFASTVDLPAGASRMDVYMQVCELAKSKTRAANLNVLFFSLEPDRLNG
ncbi:hypothetical protein [Nonomuraea sp. NPDC001831]|uniref:hypothetical protein n=1 Tax=Nonomuraea sp. NPDC001831 TaxID=3364340 RepID=UPI00368BF946